MAVTGVGNSFSYLYSTKTGKLSSTDGKEDEFVQYFNGNLSGEESEALNGFDRGKKGQIIDAATEEYYVNGQRAFTCYADMMYTPEEFLGL